MSERKQVLAVYQRSKTRRNIQSREKFNYAELVFQNNPRLISSTPTKNSTLDRELVVPGQFLPSVVPCRRARS